MRNRILGLVFFFVFILPVEAQWTTFVNGISWKDNNGNPVQAQGGNFLQYDGKWYLVGQDCSSWNAGVNLYSSNDLQSWVFERKIIPPTAYASNRFIERPKLFRCPTTAKFVVWCHYEGDQYAASEAAVFYCDSIDGIYTFHWGGRPLGIKSRDCNVFIDHDGSAYFISTTNENTDLGLFRLSDDYLSIVSHTKLLDNKYREAPAIVRINNTYFMITSGLTGWDPNQAKIAYSTSIDSGWSNMNKIGDAIAFDTQAASILTIQGSEKTTYLYVGDRWKDPGLADSKTIIFPIEFDGTTCSFTYSREFDIDFFSGQTSKNSGNYIPTSNWSIQYTDSEAFCCPSSNAIDGNINSIWHTEFNGTIPGHPHELQIDMGDNYEVSGIICVPRMDDSNNGIIRDYKLYFSVDGENWGNPVATGWMSFNTEISFNPVSARYFRLVSYSEFDGENFASVAEIQLVENTQSQITDYPVLGFRVYPNPATTHINLESVWLIKAIRLITRTGSVVQKIDNINAFNYSFDANQYSEGVYILEAIFAGGHTDSRFILLRNNKKML